MPHRIACIVFPDFQLLDMAGPVAAFEVAERIVPGSYRWRIAAPQAGPVLSSAGVAWAADALPRAGTFDTLLVAGGDGIDAVAEDARLQRWLTNAAARCARVASVCSGSHWLAAAGLLDGRCATTHWSRTRQFARRHPRVQWQPDRIYVRDGCTWTSAGISAGIDLALALIGDDLGDAVAKRVAQQLVVYHRRPGGQSQFSPLLELGRGAGRFAALLDHVRSHLGERHGVAELAERACMSPRHFARAFVAETGSTPARAVERLRADAARAALESGGGEAVQQIARRCGYANPEQMRRSFVRLFGLPPAALKRRAA
jgi:transcriptional regulator GlxA family with amidase domain